MKISIKLFIVLLFSNLTSHGQWQQTNGPYGGIIHSLACDSSEIYAGTVVGVFKSTDNGSTWVRKSGHYTTIVAISDYILYSGCSIGYPDAHLYRSLDGGNNWEVADSTLPKLPTLNGPIVYSLAILGSNVFAGIQDSGVYMSADTGKTWISKGLSYSQVNALYIQGSKIFAGTSRDGIFVSSDTGNTWTFCGFGMPRYPNGNYYGITSILSKDTLLFAGTYEGLIRSSDYGSSWSTLGNGIPIANITSLTLYSTTIIAGTSEGVYISNDDGNSWTLSDSGIINKHILSLANNGIVLFAGTDGAGVFSSSNNGNLWTPVNEGISHVVVNKIILDGNNLCAATFNGFYSSSDHGDTWTSNNNGLVGHSFGTLAISGSDIYIGNADYNIFTGLYKSSDHGNNWTLNGFNNRMIRSFYSNDNILYIGTDCSTNGFYQSIDNGVSWQLRDSGMTSSCINDIIAMGSLIIAGGSGDIFLSTDSSGTWNSIYNNNLPSPLGQTKSLLIKDSLIFLGTWGNGLYSSSDTGQTWVSKTLNLPELSYVYDMVIAGNLIFVGCQNGVYYSNNNGNTWIAANDGFENYFSYPNSLRTNCLEIDSTYIYAGVGLSSIFRRPLSDFGITTSTDSHTMSPAVSIFPNPATKDFNIVSSSEFQLFEIFNTSGAKIHSEKLSSRSKKIDTQNFSPGIYVIRISVGNQIVTRKLVIQ